MPARNERSFIITQTAEKAHWLYGIECVGMDTIYSLIFKDRQQQYYDREKQKP